MTQLRDPDVAPGFKWALAGSLALSLFSSLPSPDPEVAAADELDF